MSFFSNLFRKAPDPRDDYRRLWHAIVAKARDPFWYLKGGVADTREGRFDMLTAVLALVSITMERREGLAAATAYLTELFVEDMESQLREEGIGDPTVGKRIGKMVGALGGRIKAYRTGLDDQAIMAQAVERNVTFGGADAPSLVADKLEALFDELAGLPDEAILAGRFEAGANA